jgi:hypothetical protein
MKGLFWSHKVYRENFILVGILILKSTQASIIAISPVTTIIALLYSGWIAYKRRIKIDSFIFGLGFFYFALNIFYLASFGSNDFYLSFYIFLKLIYAYLTIKIVRESFFGIYEKIIYVLALVSLPLFLVQLINYDVVFNLVGFVNKTIPFLEYRSDRLANLYIFTLESHGSITRNAGFAWEPKGFANFLLVAIAFNLILNNFKLNKRLIIFYVALITTLSTTGLIVGFILIPIFFFINSKKSRSIKLLPLAIIPAVYFLSLDIGFEKIKKEIEGRDRYIELLEDTREFEARSLGRFPSFIVDFNDFLKRPLFGYGFNREERTQSEFTKLVRVNGLSDILATYGLFGFSIIFLSTYKSFVTPLKLLDLKGNVILLGIILVIYFASALTSHPFWMMFYFLHAINLNKQNLRLSYHLTFNEKSTSNLLFGLKKRPEAVPANP